MLHEPASLACRLRHLLEARTLPRGREPEVGEGSPDRRSLRILQAGHLVDLTFTDALRRPSRRSGRGFLRRAEHQRAKGDFVLRTRVQLGYDPTLWMPRVEERDAVGHRGIVREA